MLSDSEKYLILSSFGLTVGMSNFVHAGEIKIESSVPELVADADEFKTDAFGMTLSAKFQQALSLYEDGEFEAAESLLLPITDKFYEFHDENLVHRSNTDSMDAHVKREYGHSLRLLGRIAQRSKKLMNAEKYYAVGCKLLTDTYGADSDIS